MLEYLPEKKAEPRSLFRKETGESNLSVVSIAEAHVSAETPQKRGPVIGSKIHTWEEKIV
jgi:hypothetical protein